MEPVRRHESPRLTLVFAITFGLAALQMRRGTTLGPDAWTYWSSSVALLEGRGYVDAFDLPILAWPPLYPLWLAGVQAAFGPTIAGVIVADSLAAAWAATATSAWLRRRTAATPGAAPAVTAFAVANCLLALRGIGSELLMLALVFSALLALDVAHTRTTPARRTLAIAGSGACFVAAVLTRHAALAFVMAAATTIATTPSWSPRNRFVGVTALLGCTIATWLSVRTGLGQGGSHPFFAGHRDAGATIWAMLCGIDRVIAPFPLGLVAFAAVMLLLSPARRWLPFGRSSCTAVANRDSLPFLLVAFAATLAMFLVVEVADPPGERFVRALGLIGGGLAIGLAHEVRSIAARWALTAALALPAVAHAAKWVALGRQGKNEVRLDVGGEAFLPPHATLRRGVPAGTVLPDGGLVVEMPRFQWLEERLRSSPPTSK